MSAAVNELDWEKAIQAVIFDLDGTLVSSSLDFAQIRRDLGCPQTTDILDFIAALDEESQQSAHAIVHRHERNDAIETEAMPGAKELVSVLREKGIHTGIVTRNSRQTTKLKLEISGLSFEHVVTRECAPAKPKPDGLLQLSSSWNVNPQNCVYVGDYLFDIQAAKNAGMLSCFYSTEEPPEYASLADFVCRDYNLFLSDIGKSLTHFPC